MSSLIGSATGVLITSVALAAASWNGQKYATPIQNQINNKSEKVITSLKSDVDMFIYILQAGIHRRVLFSAVDFNGKHKINAVSTDTLKVSNS